MDEDLLSRILLVVFIVGSITFLIVSIAIIGPIYKVWSQEKQGEADLAEANWNKQIMIADAKAKKDSAELLKQAKIIEAQSIAEANKIISGSITKEYLQYEFIKGLNDGNTETIYVPTEANIPIMEAREK